MKRFLAGSISILCITLTAANFVCYMGCQQANAAEPVAFGPQQVISTAADEPTSIYAADLDGDGDLDVLSASSYDDKIAWYKNMDGAGTFGPQQVISTAADGAQSVYAADMDGDGDVDVLSASGVDDKIAWYKNLDGAGTFGPQQVISTAADSAESVYAADLDGDGDVDVLSASFRDDKIAWYKNIDGAGTFGPQQVISAAADAARSVYAADLDGDGDLDVLSASRNDARIAWYKNTDGAGTFGAQQVISTFADHASSVYAADVDGDGDMDVLSASQYDNKIAWYKNTDGAGTFGPQQVISTAALYANSVYAADLDGDGDMDVLSASSTEDKIAWYKNTDGAGTFGPQQVISTAADGANSVYAADVDGDGDLDVLSASIIDNKIAWYKNITIPPDATPTPTPTLAPTPIPFGPQQVISVLADDARSVYAADLDGDGDVDVLSASYDDDKIAWYKNTDGAGTFGEQQVISTAMDDARSVYAADLDSDGDLDVLSASRHDNKIAWYKNTDGAGTFGEQQVISTAMDDARSVYAADLDGDGDMDVLSASRQDFKIAWYKNTDGAGTFGEQQVISTSANHACSVYAADLDGDGDLDVLSASEYDDKIAWYKNTDGAGTFGAQQVISTAADYATSVYAADLDGDGDMDVLSTSMNDDKIAWYKNTDGAGTFGPQQVISTAVNDPTSVYAADMDGDGDLDVLSACYFKIACYVNADGAGNFGPQHVISTAADGAESVYAADLDGDGDLDVLSASYSDDKIAWYKNQTIYVGPTLTPTPTASPTATPTATPPSSTPVPFGWQQVISTAADSARSVYAADLDGDGDLDVLSASYNDDKIAWYKNTDGAGTFGPQRVISTLANGACSVYATDLDGDGDLDVLSASNGDNKIAWYKNMDGAGTFGPQQVISTAAQVVMSVYAADLDGDGDMDVLSASNNDHKIAWYKNTDGAGTFGPQQVLSIDDATAQSVYAVDVDGDGDSDVLSASYFKIAWYKNTDGAGTFGAQQIISTAVNGAFSVHAADVDGDGDMDVLSASASDHKVAWYKNTDGAGAFGTQQVISTVAGALSVYAVDVDNDGDTDVLSALSSDTIALSVNTDGAGTFATPQVISFYADYATSVHAADLDGDGDVDVLSASQNDDKIAWYKNQTIDDGSTPTPTTTPTGTPTKTPTRTPTVTPTAMVMATTTPAASQPVITLTYNGQPVTVTKAIGSRVENSVDLNISATDAGSPPVTLSLLSGPSGSSFLSFGNQGVFSWVPSATQVGDFQSVFRAQNEALSASTAAANFRISRAPRPIVANAGNFIAIGFTNHTNPQVWSQVFDPLTGLRLGGGKLIDGYLYPVYAYPQWDRFLAMDFDGNGSRELVVAEIAQEASLKTWISVREFMLCLKKRPDFRVLEDSAFQNPGLNEYVPADVDNDGKKELLVVGVATIPNQSWRYYLQTWDLKTATRLKSIRLMSDSAFDYTNPAWHHYMAADVNADGAEEILCIGVTNQTPPRTYCQLPEKFSFRILNAAEFALPDLNQFLTGNVDSEPNDELVAIGVTNESVKRTWVQVWNPNTGVLKYAGTRVLDGAGFALPEANRFVLADRDGSGKQLLLAIGITDSVPGQTWVQMWDLSARTRITSFRILDSPEFLDPTINEFFAMDADNNGDDELIAVGYARANNAHWVQVWDLNPVVRLKTFRVLDSTIFTHPVYNCWTGG